MQGAVVVDLLEAFLLSPMHCLPALFVSWCPAFCYEQNKRAGLMLEALLLCVHCCCSAWQPQHVFFLTCRLAGKLLDGSVFADHQADDNLLEFVVGEGETLTPGIS